MVQTLLAFGKTIKQMGKENLYIIMEIHLNEIGKMIKQMDMESIPLKRDQLS